MTMGAMLMLLTLRTVRYLMTIIVMIMTRWGRIYVAAADVVVFFYVSMLLSGHPPIKDGIHNFPNRVPRFPMGFTGSLTFPARPWHPTISP
jgi:hypothetical protein